MSDTLVVRRGFNGPRLSGNGGFVGGIMADRFTRLAGGDGTVEITFRAPIPIERPLQLACVGEALMLKDGAALICEARAGSLAELAPPPVPSDWQDVIRRGEEGGSPEGSEFYECIVCGRGRTVGDGLRVLGTSGPRPGTSLSCYLPHPNHADQTGRIRPEFVWAALDCPGAFAAQDPGDFRPALTGRMTARVIEPPKLGERCAVVGWRTGEDGRKLYSGTALYTERGQLCGLAACTWILLR